MSVNYIDKSTGDLIRVAGGGNDILYADSPIGSIIPFGGTTAPNGFLLCQGQAVSRTTYAELFAVIGTSFGSGDGSTTFNVPDLKGKTLVGLDSSDTNFNELGKTGGSKTHRHDFKFALYDYSYQPSGANAGMSGESDNAGAYRYSTGEYQGGIQTSTTPVIVSTSTGYSTETANKITSTGDTDLGSSLQPYNTVNYIIKAIQVDAPADFAPVDVIEDGNMKAVTSNAVYDTLMNITTLTPTKTANVGTIYEAEFLRIGHLVFVNLNLIISSGILFTGLPKPTSRQTFTINGFYEQNKALRLIINTNGSIETDNDLAITNQNVGGHIVYITTEN